MVSGQSYGLGAGAGEEGSWLALPSAASGGSAELAPSEFGPRGGYGAGLALVTSWHESGGEPPPSQESARSRPDESISMRPVTAPAQARPHGALITQGPAPLHCELASDQVRLRSEGEAVLPAPSPIPPPPPLLALKFCRAHAPKLRTCPMRTRTGLASALSAEPSPPRGTHL